MIPFSPPKIDQAIIDEVIDTLKSGWITTGPKTKQFEKELSEYCGNKKTLCVSSATTGLELVLRWFGIKEGDEVILPAYTYCSTGNVVAHCGAKIIMVDVNKNDFNISINAIRNAITEKTKVVIPVDLGGLPCDYNEIYSLVSEEKIKALFNPDSEEQKKIGRILILADAAHSVGAEYLEKKSGSLADISVFSFHAVKNLTTAEGGAICLNLPNNFDCQGIYQDLNIMSLHGQSKDALAKTQKSYWKYDVLFNGYKGNMTDIQASLGLVELRRYEKETLIKRKHIFDTYSKDLSKYSWAEIPFYESESKKSSYHLFLLRIKNISEEQRDNIIQNIFNEDVSVNVHFQPLPLLTAFKSKGFNINDYPVSYDNYKREISLPVYYDLSDKEIKQIINAVIKAVENNI